MEKRRPNFASAVKGDGYGASIRMNPALMTAGLPAPLETKPHRGAGIPRRGR